MKKNSVSNRKKVGTLTFFEVNNFGAELQAYALNKVLINLGYDAEIIRYYFYKNKKHKRTKLSRPIKKLPLTKALKELFYPIFSRSKTLFFL